MEPRKCEICKGRRKLTKSRREENGNYVYVEIDCECVAWRKPRIVEPRLEGSGFGNASDWAWEQR